MNIRAKFLKRPPVYQCMFGYMRSLEVHLQVAPEQSVNFFIKEFQYDEEVFGASRESLLREYYRMKNEFLNETV